MTVPQYNASNRSRRPTRAPPPPISLSLGSATPVSQAYGNPEIRRGRSVQHHRPGAGKSSTSRALSRLVPAREGEC